MFLAIIDCKRWGKGKKLVTYMTFADGRKIVAPTWPRSQYEGLANMQVDALYPQPSWNALRAAGGIGCGAGVH